MWKIPEKIKEAGGDGMGNAKAKDRKMIVSDREEFVIYLKTFDLAI